MNAIVRDSSLPPSPLTGTNAGVVLVQPINLVQLIEGYQRHHHLDVAALFANVVELNLLRDTVTGLSFFDPVVSGDSAFYAQLSHRPGYYRPNKAEYSITARYVPAGARVLEVGAGLGHFVGHLRDAEYLGTEFNPDAVAAAEELGRAVRLCDVHDLLPERQGYFDVTCAFQVLEHLPDPRRMIASLVALTRPGGRVIVSTPNAGAYISRCRDLLNAPPHHITWWEDQSWLWVARAFGLCDLELHHTPIDEMLPVWAQMIASNGIARQLNLSLDSVVDESPLRHRIDAMARPIAQTILAGIVNRLDIPEAGHSTVAVFTKPNSPERG